MNKKLYNGNISQTLWRTANIDNSLKDYEYTYDALNRITSGIFSNIDDSSKNNQYNLKLVEYDKNGNIKKLRRSGYTDSVYDEWLDQMVYTYDIGNKLTDILEQGNHHHGFADKSNTQTGDYFYDDNGNLTSDANKGITSILYNHLNLPTEVKFDDSNTKKMNYTYDATGVKLKKVVNDGGNLTTTDYAGNYIYENNTLQFFNHAEGYVEPDGSSFDYVYQYKDHLGNIRLSYHDTDGSGSIATTEIREEHNYYPFGLKHKGYNNVVTSTNPALKFKYNGKEFQDELGLNMYDYGARMYDPALGRWFVIDRLADDEMQIDKSPYAYSWNSPVILNDPDGNCPWCIGALVGALVDVAVQAIEISLDDTKTIDDFSITSVLVSAAAGATGVGLASKLKKVGTLTKLAIEATTDAAASAGTQFAKDGEVDAASVLLDVVGGQTVGKAVDNVVGAKFNSSGKGKHLKTKVNEQVNASKGKSNTISKAKANVEGAKNNLTRAAAARAGGASAAASSATSTVVQETKKKIDTKKKEQDDF